MWTKTITVEKEVPVLKIVETAAPTPLQVETDEERMAMHALQYNPGFIALVRRHKFQQDALKSKLNYERLTSLEQAQFLQAGVFWAGWLENEIKRATAKVAVKQRSSEEEELRAFQEIDAQLERIG